MPQQRPRQIFGWYGLLLRCSLALLVLLTGCTSPAGSTPTPTATPTSSATTLVVWHALGGNDEYTYTTVIQAAAAKNGVAVVMQRMPLSSIADDVRNAWQQAKGPHIALLTAAQVVSLAQRGAALPLDAVIAAPLRERIPANIRATTQYTDATGHTGWYGVPLSYSLPVLFYNSRAVLQVPATTNDLFTVGRALRNEPDWGLGADIALDLFGGYLSAANGSVVDNAGHVSLGGSGRAGAEQWLAWLAGLNNDPELLTRLNGVFRVERAVGAGQVAMVIDQSARSEIYRRVWGDHVGIAPLPVLSETGRAPEPYLQATALVVNQHLNESEARAAQALFAELLSPAVQTQLANSGYQPVIADVPAAAGSLTAQIAAAARSAIAPPPVLLRYDVHTHVQRMVTQVLAGAVAPADAVTEADSELRKLVEGTAQP